MKHFYTMMNNRIIRDKYYRARGGGAKILDIYCRKCDALQFHYQKDGKGQLHRLYLDRIRNPSAQGEVLKCHSCTAQLGIYIIFRRENRPAYRLLKQHIYYRNHKC